MPTDESYLDNLLKGLTSDTGDKEDDRLSAYRRRRNGEIRDSYDRQDIPGFLNDYVEDDKKLRFHVVPQQEDIDPDFSDDFAGEHDYFDDDRDNDDFGQDADDTIENYDIFEDDIDDSLIDEMIASELSEDEDFGKPFGVSETDFSDEETIEDRQVYEEPAYEGPVYEEPVYEESTYEEPATSINQEIQDQAEQVSDGSDYQPETAESDALSEVFGNMTGGEDSEDGDFSNVTVVSDGDEVSLVDTKELDALFDEDTDEDTDSQQQEAAQPEEAAEEPADEWVIDNSVEEIPPEEPIAEEDSSNVEILTGTDSVEELADIFSGGSEPAGPQSLNDIEGLEGLSSDDISSLDGLFSELDDSTEENKEKKAAKKEKIPFLLKIFGNVPIPEDKIKPEPTEEELAAQKAEAAEKKKAAKEEKKKAADEKKKAAAEAKAAKAKQSAEEKAEAKAKKREQMEKMLLEDVGNTQKLNLAGIIVIFAMFAAIAALIISSINTATYNASIKEAEKNFNSALENKNPDLYTEAYNQLLGLKIKDKDKILQDKVYTVNFINEDITSFNNHYAMNDKVRALRDLLDGVMNYNFYIDHAYELEIEDHLLYLRSILIGLLESEYKIGEDEAVKVIHDYDDMEKKLGDRAAKVYLTTYIYDKVQGLTNQK